MKVNQKLFKLFQRAENTAVKKNSAFITPEHTLSALTCYQTFKNAYVELGGDVDALKTDLKNYIEKYVPKATSTAVPPRSTTSEELLEDCIDLAENMGSDEITIAHYLTLFFELCDSFGVYYMFKNAKEQDTYKIITTICKAMDVEPIPPILEICDMIDKKAENNKKTNTPANGMLGGVDMMPPLQIVMPMLSGSMPMKNPNGGNEGWKSLVTCLNDEVNAPGYIPLIGREKEINETVVALLRKEKSNPVHIGDAGVGKTAIVRGLAKRLNEGNIVEELKGYKIYSCNMSSLLSGSIYRGEFEEKLKNIFEGAAKEKAILYIDEIHTICGAGGGEASNAANILKPYLLNGSIKVIGATTTKEYRKTIERDSALERRFLPITIEEPSRKETKEILNGIRGKYEEYHKCVYPDSVIDAIIELAGKHMNERKFPDKAIDLMDEAGAYIQANNMDKTVTIDTIEELVAKKCNIQRESVSSDEAKAIKELAPNMKKIVIGQDEAIDKIAKQIVVSRSGLRDVNKPVANLLFVGPTGVGKTFIAQTLADKLGVPFIKKDMSEYTEAHSVAKLFGSPAGYVGYDEGGMLINEIRKTPYCVLLIDEIEKAHPDVYNVFLQIMDDAKLTDSFGKSADFRNVVLIMTSNAGAADTKFSLGFSEGGPQIDTSAIENAVKRTFTPEFRNRLDAIIQFNPMTENMARDITKNQLKELSDILADKNVVMTYSSDIVDYIVKKGYSTQYGARNIKRVIENDIKTLLGSELLFGSLKDGGDCKLSFENDKISIT